jgi:hypothetical protein
MLTTTSDTTRFADVFGLVERRDLNGHALPKVPELLLREFWRGSQRPNQAELKIFADLIPQFEDSDELLHEMEVLHDSEGANPLSAGVDLQPEPRIEYTAQDVLPFGKFA